MLRFDGWSIVWGGVATAVVMAFSQIIRLMGFDGILYPHTSFHVWQLFFLTALAANIGRKGVQSIWEGNSGND